MSLPQFSIIVACDSEWGIALNGKIPFNDKQDLENFKTITTQGSNDRIHNVVIMGRKTFESLPKSVRPLPNRLNIVITSKVLIDGPIVTAKSLNEALKYCKEFASPKTSDDIKLNLDGIFVCGGAALYAEAMRHPACKRVYIHRVSGDYKCDVKVPELAGILSDNWSIEEFYHGHSVCNRLNKAEQNYLDLCNKIIEQGVVKPNRTGIHSYSLFAQTLRYPLSDCDVPIIPLFTSKRVSFKLVYSELLWMLGGGTDTDFLHKHDNHIWDGNTSRAFLDKQGLTEYEEGELGAGYGFQWRHFGATYMPKKDRKLIQSDLKIDGNNSLSNDLVNIFHAVDGVDQIANVIKSIRTDPYGRRHLVSAWNPSALHAMALVPCHFTFTLYVEPDEEDLNEQPKPKYLSCHLTMRSNDMFLGHPFNVASYGTLTHMIALVTGLVARELVISMTDCHVYNNHLDQVKEQSSRPLYGFPTFKWSKEILDKSSQHNLSVDDFNMDSIEIIDYNCGKLIRAEMAV